MKHKILGPIGLILAAIILGAFAFPSYRQGEASLAGRKAKDFQMQIPGAARLSDLQGKVVILNFWASWCQPCASEAADLEATWRSYEETGKVVFLGVDYVDTEPEARAYMTEFDLSYPNGPDMGARISHIFNRNLGVPETYFIDRQGVLRFIQIGPFQSVAEIQAIIDPLLVVR